LVKSKNIQKFAPYKNNKNELYNLSYVSHDVENSAEDAYGIILNFKI